MGSYEGIVGGSAIVTGRGKGEGLRGTRMRETEEEGGEGREGQVYLDLELDRRRKVSDVARL